jgi:beta-glucosidase
MNLSKPAIVAEFEKDANAIVANFGVQNQAILDVLSGAVEPSGLLPFQMPANMKTVEQQDEDIPHDMICYTDADHHTYDFGFGMNWKGVIHDARTAKYVDRVHAPAFHGQNLTINLTCSTPGAKIYYSTDDSTPSFTEDHEYTKPFKIKKGAVIKAIAKIYGVDNSDMVVMTVSNTKQAAR